MSILWITQLVCIFPDYFGTRNHFTALWTLYVLNPNHFHTPHFKCAAFLSRLNLFVYFLHHACCITHPSSFSWCCAFILFNEEHELRSVKLCDFSRPLVKMPIAFLSNICWSAVSVHCDEISAFVQHEEFLGQLRDCQILKKCSASWNLQCRG